MGAKRRKRSRPKKQTVKTLQEIQHYQSSGKLLIRRAPFARVVRDVLLNCRPDGAEFRWQRAAIDCLQEACEAYLVHLMSDAYLCAIHAKRVTLMPRDFHLISKLRS